MIDENIHYRIPLKLINSYSWARLNYPARAILPIIGIHVDLRINQAKPGIKLISDLSGYSNLEYVRAGINDLINHNLIVRQKEGRHYVYSLTDLSFCKRGSSYFPIYKNAMVLSGKWAGLTPCEKSLYTVLGIKAKINDPDVEDSGFHAIGHIYHSEINEYIEWAGISRSSFYNAYQSLNHKNLIEREDIYSHGYGIYVPQ